VEALATIPAVGDALDLIDAVLYGDVFDSAVTEDEVWRYSRRPIGREELGRRLREDPVVRAFVHELDGLYTLAGREELMERRPAADRRALKLRHRAVRVARWLRHVPFVRGLLLTGSAAAGAARPGADVDLLVIVEDGRISFVFALLGPLSRLASRRLFCPNHYLSAKHLVLDRRRDLYVAHELVQARPLAGCAPGLRDANDWVEALLPNACEKPPPEPLAGGGRLQRALELPLRGRFGDRLERRLRRLALARLAVHHRGWDGGVPAGAVERLEAGAELRFHGEPGTQSVLRRYEERRAEVAERLARQPT
jgi:nucleotidyltransferase-like protein